VRWPWEQKGGRGAEGRGKEEVAEGQRGQRGLEQREGPIHLFVTSGVNDFFRASLPLLPHLGCEGPTDNEAICSLELVSVMTSHTDSRNCLVVAVGER